MNIRRFRAHNASEALAMVKAELGDDAVILNTSRRRVRDAGSGALMSVVEVVAAVDFDIDHETAPVSSSENMEPVLQQPSESGENPQSMAKTAGDDQNTAALHEEIRQLRDMVEKITLSVSSGGQRGLSSGAAGAISSSIPSSSHYPLMVMQEVFDFLKMDPDLQRGFASAFLKSYPAGRPVNHRAVYSWLRKKCSGMIAAGELIHSSSMPRWWAFIGPTGVGKTTTLAKIAAHLKFRHGLKGHIITVDTYRLGGVEQLKKYADIMEIPFSAASNTGELVKIFSENRELDFILVDTIGRNSRSSKHQTELEKMFDAVPGLKAMAFICATYRSSDMAATVKTYRRFPVKGWTISKADETLSPGALCTPVLGWRLPLSYITDGQKVPEDIKHATRGNVMELLFARGDEHFRGTSDRVPPRKTGSSVADTAMVEG